MATNSPEVDEALDSDEALDGIVPLSFLSQSFICIEESITHSLENQESVAT